MRNLVLRTFRPIKSATSVAVCLWAAGNLSAAGPVLTSTTINEIVAGSTVHIDTPLGITLPMTFEADGTVRGSAGKVLSFYMEAESDHGRWWVADNKLCQKWRKWFESKPNCLSLQREGAKYAWVRDDGKTGTASIITRPTPSIMANIEQKPEPMPRLNSLGGPVTSAPPPTPAPIASIAVKPAPIVVQQKPVAKVLTSHVPGITAPTPAKAPITVVTEVPSPSMPRGIIYRVVNVAANDTLNLRSAPNTTAAVVSFVPHQARGLVMVGECTGVWCPMSHGGKSGWVHRTYLALEPMIASSAR